MVQHWKALTLAACAVAAQSVPAAASAQALAAGNGGASRDPWRLSSGVSVDETWSDNINLAPAGSERSDFVTTVSPSLRLTRYGSRLTADFTYTPQYLYYARGTNGNGLRNYLSAAANATLIDNFLFFDGAATVSQQNVSPFGTQAANTVNGSSNRAETRTISFGPTLRSRYGQDLSYTAGYRYAQSSADNTAYATNHTSQLFGQFQTSTSFRDVGIGGSFNRTDQEYGGANRIVTDSVNSTLTYVLTPTFHLQGNLGYDRSRYPTTGQPDLSGLSYSGGFDWEPTHHTSVSAQIGHRYFGPTANIQVRETTSKLALSASYTRDQTTTSASGLALTVDPNYALVDQFLQATIPDPVARAQAVTAALLQSGLPASQYGTTGFLSNQLYVQKRADVSAALLGLRNTVTFGASLTESQSLSALSSGFDVFNQSQKFRSTQYSVFWSHKLGPRTSANAGVTKSRSQAVQGSGDSRQRSFSASITRQFQQRLSGSVLYRNTTQTSDFTSGGFYSGNYRENAVLGSLRLTF